jgi:hypothetical protein
MKTIIRGIRYDTETAILIGEGSSSTPYRSDFGFWEASLYRTKRSGRYFLAGSGGPLTMFSRNLDGNTRTGGEGIVTLSEESALEWAEQHLDVSVVEQHFGHLIED